jgi:NADH:ubiquinone oxidoreductase subunit C
LTSKYIYSQAYFIKLNSLILANLSVDIVVYDNPGKTYRFTIIYSFLSTFYNTRFYYIIQLNELMPIYSLSFLFPNLTWSERENWDIFGIFFINNTDLRRILTDYGFKGHPLRKDFPLTGFYEIAYNDTLRRIVHSRVELTQEFRVFTFDFNNKIFNI